MKFLKNAPVADLERSLAELGVVQIDGRCSRGVWKIALIGEQHQGLGEGPLAEALYLASLDLVRRQKGGT